MELDGEVHGMLISQLSLKLTQLQIDLEISALKILYRINNQFSEENFELLQQLESDRPAGTSCPWSQNKLQATIFLNSPDDIKKECIEGIYLSLSLVTSNHYLTSANAAGKLDSNDDMNLFCLKKYAPRLLEAYFERNKLEPAHITVDMTEKVYPPLNYCA